MELGLLFVVMLKENVPVVFEGDVMLLAAPFSAMIFNFLLLVLSVDSASDEGSGDNERF